MFVRNVRTVKKNMNSRCVNHVYTLPPKLSSDIKKFGSGSAFRIRSKHFEKKRMRNMEQWKMHANISDSECNDLKSGILHNVHCSCF